MTRELRGDDEARFALLVLAPKEFVDIREFFNTLNDGACIKEEGKTLDYDKAAPFD